MSDTPFDEDELMEAYEGDPDNMSPEDIFKMVTINRQKMTKVRVELRDEEEDVIELVDVVIELLGYLKDKFEDETGDKVPANWRSE